MFLQFADQRPPLDTQIHSVNRAESGCPAGRASRVGCLLAGATALAGRATVKTAERYHIAPRLAIPGAPGAAALAAALAGQFEQLRGIG